MESRRKIGLFSYFRSTLATSWLLTTTSLLRLPPSNISRLAFVASQKVDRVKWLNSFTFITSYAPNVDHRGSAHKEHLLLQKSNPKEHQTRTPIYWRQRLSLCYPCDEPLSAQDTIPLTETRSEIFVEKERAILFVKHLVLLSCSLSAFFQSLYSRYFEYLLVHFLIFV